MTLTMDTFSHGLIDTGYSRKFTKMTSLGIYAFETERFCDMLKYLAQHPEEQGIEVTGYDIKKFWDMEQEFRENMFDIMNSTPEPILALKLRDAYLSEKAGRMDEEDKKTHLKDGMDIPVILDEDHEIITIGKYDIGKFHFNCLVYYVLQGGIGKWDDDIKPEYCKETYKAIKESESWLFQD